MNEENKGFVIGLGIAIVIILFAFWVSSGTPANQQSGDPVCVQYGDC